MLRELKIADRVAERVPWGMQTVDVPERTGRAPSRGGLKTYREIADIHAKKTGKVLCPMTFITAERTAMAKIYKELVKRFPELEGLGPVASATD